ncbi:MAG: hypothetical protein ABSA14_14775 [Acidimicrobiales bacterium]
MNSPDDASVLDAAPSDIPTVIAYLGKRWDVHPDDARRIVHDDLAALYAATVAVATAP